MEISDLEVHIKFGRDEYEVEPVWFKWKVLDTEVTPYWLKFFIFNLKNNLFFKPRFMGFIDGERNPVFLEKKMNECIDIINKDGRHKIERHFKLPFTQDYSNYIHHEFELLIGDQWKKTKYWEKSSDEVRSAVCGLNDYAHELEAWHRSLDGRKDDPDFTMSYVLTEFFEAPGMDVKDKFEDEFTLDTEFGDMTLHYTQIGKTWLEVCLDKDEDIFDPAIQPLWFLSGSFNIMFHEVDVPALKNEVYAHLKKLGKDPNDKSLRLGLVPIAKLMSEGRSKIEMVKLLSERQDISRIELRNGDSVVTSNDFPPKAERYFIKN